MDGIARVDEVGVVDLLNFEIIPAFWNVVDVAFGCEERGVIAAVLDIEVQQVRIRLIAVHKPLQKAHEHFFYRFRLHFKA